MARFPTQRSRLATLRALAEIATAGNRRDVVQFTNNALADVVNNFNFLDVTFSRPVKELLAAYQNLLEKELSFEVLLQRRRVAVIKRLAIVAKQISRFYLPGKTMSGFQK